MIRILCRHLDLYEQWGSSKPFQTLKKFFKIYVNSWPGAGDLRAELMQAADPAEVRRILAGSTVPTLTSPLH
jgi:tRNA-dihydrouridine synthase